MSLGTGNNRSEQNEELHGAYILVEKDNRQTTIKKYKAEWGRRRLLFHTGWSGKALLICLKLSQVPKERRE